MRFDLDLNVATLLLEKDLNYNFEEIEKCNE